MAETPLVNSIHSIEDFKRIDPKQYPELAAQIRSFLVEKVSRTGGHLASNLGVVELTIALHAVFHSPEDKLIFDVGHQAYVHKILTGRAGEFDSLRKKGGLSGFPKRCESEHDAFDTGHASTSISAALGIARGDAILGRKRSVVAILGDGALTGGVSFEALNDAGQSKLPLIVVVNDNAMSISKNVGAMSRHLYQMRGSASYQRFKSGIAEFLHKIPRVGQRLSNRFLRLKNRIKYLLIPNVLFEELGFTYLGPVDGHDTAALTKVLCQARELGRPVVVHALTVKGKGYVFAENDPERFHGIGRFDARTGKVNITNGGISNSSVFAEQLTRLAEQDKRIAAITAAMPSGTGLDEFAGRFPARFFDVGIAEEHAVTMAAGMALAGARPVVAIYSTFLQRAYDQIIHDVCLQGLPVVFAIDRAGLVGEDGETHQGVYDISFLMNLYGMSVMSPATREELRQMLTLALSLEHPCAIRYNRGSLPDRPLRGPIVFGQWEEICPIAPVTVVAQGRLVATALAACEGTQAGVVNARFLKPMDEGMLRRIGEKARHVITLEDGMKENGMGAAIRCRLAGKAETHVLGVIEEPVLHASIQEQDEVCGISQAQVRQLVLALCGKGEQQ